MNEQRANEQTDGTEPETEGHGPIIHTRTRPAVAADAAQGDRAAEVDGHGIVKLSRTQPVVSEGTEVE